MVSSANDITDTQYALSATQNNPAIEGSIRKSILDLSTKVDQNYLYFFRKSNGKSGEFRGAGWIRLFSFNKANAGYASGNCTNCTDIILKRFYNNHNSEMWNISLFSSNYKSQFIINQKHIIQQTITKIRHVVHANAQEAYIDIYYNAESENVCYYGTHNGETSYGAYWEVIQETHVPEIDSNFTVISELNLS